MTLHPTLQILIHFPFISTSNKFFPMKVTKGKWKHLLKRSGIGYLRLQLHSCKGTSDYYKGHGEQKQQSFSLPSLQIQSLLQLALRQTDTCLNIHQYWLMAHAYVVVYGLMAWRIFVCLGAHTGISSSFQCLNIWTSQSPRGGKQLWGRGEGGLFRELWKGSGSVGVWGGSAYLTPRGKFKEVRYQLNQYTPLHFTEMAAESHLSGDVLSYSPPYFKQTTSVWGFRKASEPVCDEAWRHVLREDLQW